MAGCRSCVELFSGTSSLVVVALFFNRSVKCRTRPIAAAKPWSFVSVASLNVYLREYMHIFASVAVLFLHHITAFLCIISAGLKMCEFADDVAPALRKFRSVNPS